ncbi:conjugal transfer protein TraF [Vreelandella massiliensis]|uniref:conjugal transfer protein TraF n=1 Tax=Vreelandella massiliensis TaxID=1816686 RepID=UPI00096A9853|nr:conjugal transfer protein TraF [Halomonas massiliensis]
MALPNLRLRTFALALALTMPAPALALDNAPQQSTFWEDGRDGWFFYESPPEPEPEPEKEPNKEPETVAKKTPPPAPEPKKQTPKPQEAQQPEGPPALSAAWFRENLEKYEDAAWNNPTVENVRAYMYLQRYVMDRSEQFAQSAQLAVLGDPVLDETNRRPSASAAAQRQTERANRTRNRLVSELAEEVGMFFFYSSTCEACATMAPVIRELEKDFAVIPISLDGKHLPGNPFPNMRRDQGHAEQIGVPRAPALYLAAPGEIFEPIAHSPVSVDDARHRILIGAYRQGWVTQEEYNSARPIENLDVDLTRMLANEDLSDLQRDSDTNFIPPNELMRVVKEAENSFFEEQSQ